MDNNKKTPVLESDVKNEQNVDNRNHAKATESKNDTKDVKKNDAKNIPESNDPAGYGEEGSQKQSPSGQRKS